MILAVDKALRDLGYEFTSMEKLLSPIIYSDKNGNEVVYNRFICSDPERIASNDELFYTEVFDPMTADSVQDIFVNDAEALLCEKDGHSYLIWYPNGNIILMLDYDNNVVSGAEILKMAESCK